MGDLPDSGPSPHIHTHTHTQVLATPRSDITQSIGRIMRGAGAEVSSATATGGCVHALMCVCVCVCVCACIGVCVCVASPELHVLPVLNWK